jgi:hypothetical protein
MNDTLVGVGRPHDPEPCPEHTSSLLLTSGLVLIGVGIFSVTITFVRGTLHQKLDLNIMLSNALSWTSDNTTKLKAISILGTALIVIAIGLISVGGACMDSNLVNVDDCRQSGAIFFTIAIEILVVGIMLRLWTYSNAKPDSLLHSTPLLWGVAGVCGGLIQASTGGACIEENMAGVDGGHNCRGFGGILVITGLLTMVFSVIMCIGIVFWHLTKASMHEKLTARIPKPLMLLCQPTCAGMCALGLDIGGLSIIAIGASCMNDTLLGIVSLSTVHARPHGFSCASFYADMHGVAGRLPDPWYFYGYRWAGNGCGWHTHNRPGEQLGSLQNDSKKLDRCVPTSSWDCRTALVCARLDFNRCRRCVLQRQSSWC